nr:hypothetical protein [Thermococcus stetteri]
MLVLIIVAAPLGYIAYGYTQFSGLLAPKENATVHTYMVLHFPNGTYVAVPEPYYLNITKGGKKVPVGVRVYSVDVFGYLTGFPESDINATMLSKYERFTIIVGSTKVKACSKNPSEFRGDCSLRSAAVSEISALTSTLFKIPYYQEALKKGMDNASARQYAYEQTINRYDVRYLSMMTKVAIGTGRLGNKDHLAVVLIGPAEGGEENRIFTPRRGLLILEASSDDALRAEVVLIETILNFKWPSGEKNKQVASNSTKS